MGDGVTNDLLGAGVGSGGVDQVDAFIQQRIEDPGDLVLFGLQVADLRAAEAEGGDVMAGLAEGFSLHGMGFSSVAYSERRPRRWGGRRQENNSAPQVGKWRNQYPAVEFIGGNVRLPQCPGCLPDVCAFDGKGGHEG